MNKAIVVGAALVAGIAIASPMIAWSAADSGPQAAQAAADQPGMGAGGGRHHEGPSPMGRHRGDMHKLLMRPIRPALEQFYQALTADQKAIVDHPFRRG